MTARKETTSAPDQTSDAQQLDARQILTVLGGSAAPILFVENVPLFLLHDGITHLTLEATRAVSVGGITLTDRVAVGHLRLTPNAVRTLKEALQRLDARAPAATPGSTIN